jgi:hypothetical protein
MPPEKKAQRGAEGESVREAEEDIVLSPSSPSPLSRSSSSSSSCSPTSVDQLNRTECDRTSVDEDDSNSQEPNEAVEAGLTQVGEGSGRGREGLKVSEEATAGIFSRMTFSWTSNLVNIAKGFEREVELQKKKQEEEVGEASDARGRGKVTNSRKQRSASLPRIRGGKDFKRLPDEREGEPGEEEEGEEEERTSKQTSRLEESHLLTLPFEETVTESTKVLKKTWKQQVLNSRAPSSASTSCSPPPSPSLFSALYSAFGRYFYLGVILKLLADSATFTSPVLLNHLLEYLALDPVPTPFDYPYVLSLILGISLCQIVFSISTHQVSVVTKG